MLPSHDAPDLLYSEEEEALRSAVRSLLADHCDLAAVLARTESDTPHDRELFRRLAQDMGLAGLLVPERFGGLGATHREAAVVLEELGRALAPVPFLTSTVIATEALLGCLAGGAGDTAAGAPTGAVPGTPGRRGGEPETESAGDPVGGRASTPEHEHHPAAELLTALATGGTVAVLAVPLSAGPVASEPADRDTPHAAPQPVTPRSLAPAPSSTAHSVPAADSSTAPTVVRPDSGMLYGRITGVADAALADVLLVPADEGLYAVDVRQDAVTVTPQIALDSTRPLAEVACTGARARLLSPDTQNVVQRALCAGAGLLASEQLGIADWCLAETVRYTRERRQFNRPVGSFQALKHRLAQLWLTTVHARAAARNAADALSTGGPGIALAVVLAQSCASDVAVHAAEEALQLHGGIGMTWEHPVHLFLKRAKADSIALGTASHHRAQLTLLAALPAPTDT
jgi:alkylation response protein AidB-like acyl-CoA dehydrogenase